MTEKHTGLDVMRMPFPESYIGKLPKGTKAQNECQASEKVNCKVCGGWHHPRIVHLDYVGHAAITQRLLDADPMWSWEPMAFDEQGLPRLDESGGLWIRLTVSGMTRIGYGDASGKHGPSAIKEAIGDALRNASMRFGAALDLWHKGDWEVDTLPDAPIDPVQPVAEDTVLDWIAAITETTTKEEAKAKWQEGVKACAALNDREAADRLKAALLAHADKLDGDAAYPVGHGEGFEDE